MSNNMLLPASLSAHVFFLLFVCRLLLVGGISLLCAFYIGTLDFDKDMKKAAIVNTTNIVCFIYARFIQFPYHSYYLMKDIRADRHSTLVVGLFSVYFIFMSIYNLGVLSELLPQGIRYILRAMNGVTAADDGPQVPPPKEGKMKQRRSSVQRMLLRANAALQHPPSNGRHRSSRFSAVLMPDPIYAALDESFDDEKYD